MLRILDIKYSDCQPIAPKYNAVCVFDVKTARLAFEYGAMDFVIALNEKNEKFAYCYSVQDVEEFLNTI